MRLALVSPPFADASTPSIQLATLRAWLTEKAPWVTVDLYHHTLDVAAAISPTTYDRLCQSAFAGEALYAALLHPERRESAFTVLLQSLAPTADDAAARAAQLPLLRAAGEATERLCQQLTATRYDLIGISVCLAQLMPAVYIAQRLKRMAPTARVVLGGSATSGPVGPSLLEAYPFLDYMIDGEGEIALEQLCLHLKTGDRQQPVEVPGLIYRDASHQIVRNPTRQLPDLDALPALSFEEYFTKRRGLPPDEQPLRPPRLLVEASRGCWWDRTLRRSDQICAFCNLNVQWGGYREKSIARVREEVRALTEETRCLDVAFVDNILRYKGATKLFEELEALGRDLSLVYELRAQVTDEELRAFQRAGGREVQVGIEALTTRLLRTMVKGTTAAQNVWLMRRCEELGIRNNANLILGHPGAVSDDVRETVECIPALAHLYPLQPSAFWLGAGSLIERDPERFGITNIRNHDVWRTLLPEEIEKKLTLLDRSFDAVATAAAPPSWAPVLRALEDWRVTYEARCKDSRRPILWLREGETFLTVQDRRRAGGVRETKLEGNMAALYRFFSEVRSRQAVLERFPLAQASDLEHTIARFVEAKLVFDDAGQHTVALAVRPGRP